nr:putative reverse transcriptase domain-containing protein [Tanacetum cinerariifolium]
MYLTQHKGRIVRGTLWPEVSITDVLGRGWRGTTYRSRNDSRNDRKDHLDQAKDTSCSGSTKSYADRKQKLMEFEFRDRVMLKRSHIPLVKVCWNSRRGLEFTWEREDSFKQKYPHLFTNRTPSSTTRVVVSSLSITSSTTTLSIYVVVSQAESIQLQLQRPRQQIMDTLNGLKTWYLIKCGVKYQLAMTNMLSEESRIGGANVNSSMNLRSIGNLLEIDDDKLYKFKEGDFKRLHVQDIEDMLLLVVQGKLTNIMVDERFSFNVSLRMFTRSIVTQRRMEDLQLGGKSYQKKLNLTKPDTDGTLNYVRTALDDRLKGIQMQYLPQTIWRRSDKDRAAAMIQAIDKQLKTKRIMRSLEKFIGERLYEGDFRLL